MEYKEVKDSGERLQYPTGAVRDTTTGKGRYDLLPCYAMQRLAQHYENGARKYSSRNWEQGIETSRFLDSAIRHLFQYLAGDRSEDHLAAAAWNALGLIETEHRIEQGRLPITLDTLPTSYVWAPGTVVQYPVEVPVTREGYSLAGDPVLGDKLNQLSEADLDFLEEHNDDWTCPSFRHGGPCGTCDRRQRLYEEVCS